MRKYRVLCAVLVLLMTQSSFANTDKAAGNEDLSLKQCRDIAHACLNAGYVRGPEPGKTFWNDCMKPILMGKTVEGVKMKSSEGAACRKFKIEKMKKELKELESVSNHTSE